ncbi:siderophore-iron reductase FhuF [Halomonas sp. 7T]|uniref:siderophore-iron reductase FhuF n=1 Tax=Halomonas sp. 7T TaxID=2893469 RepID=UPI0021D89CDA|nr:siderophore-iron reductase FhuF [Halomonas sp. 7T]UXZ54124.1 siderophore-iron reductase FhuF [Halomonas sp. 7T]
MSSLQWLYQDALSAFTAPSFGPRPPTPLLPGEALSDAAQLRQHVLHFGAADLNSDDLKASASLWSRWHFSAVIAPALAAHLLLSRQLPLALNQVALHLSDSRRTERLHFAHEGSAPQTSEPFAVFSLLIDAHLTSVIATLASLSGVSPRVFWNNAGTYFDYFTDVFAAHPSVEPQRLAEAHAILTQRQRPDGQLNPLYQPVSVGADGKRKRRLCCLRYRIPALGYCDNCPIACKRRHEKADTKKARAVHGRGRKEGSKQRV